MPSVSESVVGTNINVCNPATPAGGTGGLTASEVREIVRSEDVDTINLMNAQLVALQAIAMHLTLMTEEDVEGQTALEVGE